MDAQKIIAVENALESMRYARNDPTCPEHAAYNLLKEYAAELRARAPSEIGKVHAAMSDQVQRARASKARLGFYDVGNERTICEGVCGRWWPIIDRALRELKDAATV